MTAVARALDAKARVYFIGMLNEVFRSPQELKSV